MNKFDVFLQKLNCMCIQIYSLKLCGWLKDVHGKGTRTCEMKHFCGAVFWVGLTPIVVNTFSLTKENLSGVHSHFFELSNHPQVLCLCHRLVSELFSVAPLSCSVKASEDEEGRSHTVHKDRGKRLSTLHWQSHIHLNEAFSQSFLTLFFCMSQSVFQPE